MLESVTCRVGIQMFADSNSTDESFLNIKMDSSTKQYTIGSPVSLSMWPTQADNLKKFRMTKSSYSLADIHTADDRGKLLLVFSTCINIIYEFP